MIIKRNNYYKRNNLTLNHNLKYSNYNSNPRSNKCYPHNKDYNTNFSLNRVSLKNNSLLKYRDNYLRRFHLSYPQKFMFKT